MTTAAAAISYNVEQVCTIPNNVHNLRRVKRAIAIARDRCREWIRLHSVIYTTADRIFFDTPKPQVNRIAHRLLTHDWQAGRLADVAPMDYSAVLYTRVCSICAETQDTTYEIGMLSPQGLFYKEIVTIPLEYRCITPVTISVAELVDGATVL